MLLKAITLGLAVGLAAALSDPFCLHALDEEDHKCIEGCAASNFSQVGVSLDGACPPEYNTVDKEFLTLQCPDGVTNLRYCPDTAMNVTMHIKGEEETSQEEMTTLVRANSPDTPETASSVCVYNGAAFVLKWRLHDNANGAESAETNSYPVGQTTCLPATSVAGDIAAGAVLVPKVKAIWGKEITASKTVLYDPANATQITYVCKGTTLFFSCKQGPSPPSAANVTKAVGEFFLGFVEGLGDGIGFASCLTDLEETFHAIVAIVDFFENGINGKVLPTIIKAFELLGSLLMDVSKAVTACVAEGAAFASKMASVGTALSGDVMSIIKVVIGELVHIFHDRDEITTDCKTTATSWRGGDYKSSGKAVGDIVGVIIGGL